MQWPPRDFGWCTASTCCADPARSSDREIQVTACGGGALADADHHLVGADRLHVAALDVAAAPVLVAAAQPDGDFSVANVGLNR